MCYDINRQIDWREKLREAEADKEDPPTVDIAEPEIGEPEIEEPKLDEPDIGQADLD